MNPLGRPFDFTHVEGVLFQTFAGPNPQLSQYASETLYWRLSGSIYWKLKKLVFWKLQDEWRKL